MSCSTYWVYYEVRDVRYRHLLKLRGSSISWSLLAEQCLLCQKITIQYVWVLLFVRQHDLSSPHSVGMPRKGMRATSCHPLFVPQYNISLWNHLCLSYMLGLCQRLCVLEPFYIGSMGTHTPRCQGFERGTTHEKEWCKQTHFACSDKLPPSTS